MRIQKKDHNSLEYAVMGLIRHGVTYGYEILKHVSDKKGLGQIWATKSGNLYALLGKLEATGWLTSSVTTAGNRPPRKDYALTLEGEKAFVDWCSSVVTHPREMRQDFLVKWFFIRSDLGMSSKLIRDQLTECSNWERGLFAKEEKMENSDLFGSTTHKFRINQIRGIKTWLIRLQKGEL
jgi:DNA-binding PadR family transcriptional regulator